MYDALHRTAVGSSCYARLNDVALMAGLTGSWFTGRGAKWDEYQPASGQQCRATAFP